MTYTEYCSFCGYAKEGSYCHCDTNKKPLNKKEIDYKKRCAFLELYLCSVGKKENNFRDWIKSVYPEIEKDIFDRVI